MKYSKIALLVLAAKEAGFIKSNAQFWSNFEKKENFFSEIQYETSIHNLSLNLSNELNHLSDEYGVICAYDEEFPKIGKYVKNNGDKPFLLFYRGNFDLLFNYDNNVAVIGHIKPTEDVIKREIEIVSKLSNSGLNIVSGLANGCDTIAHQTCVNNNGATIAILPTPLNKIYPASNKSFAEKIVNSNGLLVTEYYKEPNSKREAINRFIERDRLQAMFSKAIILIASYKKGEGDSGSRHAMDAAKRYKIERFVMFNESVDDGDKQFGLNKEILKSKEENAKLLTLSSIDYIKSIVSRNVKEETIGDKYEQITFL